MVTLSFAVALPESLRISVHSDAVRAIDELSRDADQRDDGIHEARRAIRRVRAKLALIRPYAGRDAARALQAPWREAGRALSALRDADSLRKAIVAARADAANGFDPDALVLLDASARRRHARAAARDDGVVDAVRASLIAAHAALPDWEGFDDASLVAGLCAGYGAGIARLRALIEDEHEESWHALRRAARTHWLQLELVIPLWTAVIKAQSQQARRLSQMLGTERDLAMIEALAAGSRRRGADGERVRALLPRIGAERARLRARALRRARRQFCERERDFGRRIGRLLQLAREGNSRADPAQFGM
jgi:CHAD domain-containing protein